MSFTTKINNPYAKSRTPVAADGSIPGSAPDHWNQVTMNTDAKGHNQRPLIKRVDCGTVVNRPSIGGNTPSANNKSLTLHKASSTRKATPSPAPARASKKTKVGSQLSQVNIERLAEQVWNSDQFMQAIQSASEHVLTTKQGVNAIKKTIFDHHGGGLVRRITRNVLDSEEFVKAVGNVLTQKKVMVEDSDSDSDSEEEFA